MKLVSAKCPNCNASIELNENLEKGICQYCGETVYVKEALEKQKLELSGNVNVTIDHDSKKIKNIKNYLKLNDIINAKKLLNEVLNSDPFNLDALELKTEIDFNDLVKEYHLDDSNNSLELSGTIYENDLNILEKKVKELLNDLDKIKKIDEEEKVEDNINKYHDLYQKLLTEIKVEKNNLLKTENNTSNNNTKTLVIILGVVLIFIVLMIIILIQNKNEVENTSTNETTTVVSEEPISTKVKVYVFYGETCPHCQELHTYLEELQKTNNKFEVIDYEVWNSDENNYLLSKVAVYFNTDIAGVPFYVIGDKYYEGYSEDMNNEIEDRINEVYANNTFDIMDNIN